MPIRIRRALPQDAQAITELIAASFHEEADPAHIQALIEEGEHLTFVAEDEKLVGFIDGFYTYVPIKIRRLELDLLAVHPEYSGKGIGKKLIQTFTEVQENAAFIRSLVAVDNTPMHKAMFGTGFAQMGKPPFSLYISDSNVGTSDALADNDFQLIPVKTFTYTGIWLEGFISQKAIYEACVYRQKLGYEIVGAVVRDYPHFKSKIETLKSEGFKFIKQFNWWTHPIITEEQFSAHLNNENQEHGD